MWFKALQITAGHGRTHTASLIPMRAYVVEQLEAWGYGPVWAAPKQDALWYFCTTIPRGRVRREDEETLLKKGTFVLIVGPGVDGKIVHKRHLAMAGWEGSPEEARSLVRQIIEYRRLDERSAIRISGLAVDDFTSMMDGDPGADQKTWHSVLEAFGVEVARMPWDLE